jgi:hypothetical protein
MSEDKRKFDRVDTTLLQLRASITVDGKPQSDCVVPVRDFSKGGACIYSKFKLAPKTVVTLHFADLPLKPFEGCVAWCAPTDEEDEVSKDFVCRLGLDFRAKDKLQQEHINAAFEYLSKLIEQAGPIVDGDDEA